MSQIRRVVDQYKYATRWDGKFVGKNARLQWSRGTFQLEELPQKGKKKLREASIQNPNFNGGLDWWLPENILMLADLSSSDDYDKIKDKISKAYQEAEERIMKGTRPTERAQQEYLKKNPWVQQIKWYENQVFYLNVVPEGVGPFTAEGKDFTVRTEWTLFSAYSPDSDFQQAEPYYTKYESKSPTAARKFYMTLKADPNALKSVSWDKFREWLNQQKIPFETRFSQWR